MRRILILLPLLAVAACDMAAKPTGPVDAASLPPLSGKEQALMVAADGELRTGDKASAERDYQGAIAQSGGHIEAHLALAKLYISEKQSDKARDVLERARIFQPNQSEVNYLLGKIYLSENKAKAASDAFARGLATDPESLDLLNGAGIASDMLRDQPRAQVMYLRAIALHPKDDLSMVRTNLAMSYLLSNEPKKAAEQLKDEVKKPGVSPTTRHNLALAYGLMGHHAEAKSLTSKEMTDEERKLSIERLKKYIANEPAANPAPEVPTAKK